AFSDVEALLEVLQKLVDGGNTVVVIEHNLDVIKCADHLIDMGPAGGAKGGYIIATGSPEEVAGVEDSMTGRFLRDVLSKHPPIPGEPKVKRAPKAPPASDAPPAKPKRAA